VATSRENFDVPPSPVASIWCSAQQRAFVHDQLPVTAIEHVVLDAGLPKIGLAAGQIRQRLLGARHDPHAAVGYRNDDVVVLMAMKSRVGARNQTVPGYARPSVVDLTVSFFEHGHLGQRV